MPSPPPRQDRDAARRRERPDDATRLRLPKRIVIPAVAAVAAIIVLLALVLVSINAVLGSLQQANGRLHLANGRLDVANAGVGALNDKVAPLQRVAPPILRSIGPDVQGTRSDVDVIVSMTRGLGDALVPLARTAQTLLTTQPVGRAVAAAASTLGDVERLDLLHTADRALRDVPVLTRTLGRADGHIVQLRDILRTALSTLVASRRVQCLTLVHIASIDRKTGGPLPPDTPAPPADVPAACRDVAP